MGPRDLTRGEIMQALLPFIGSVILCTVTFLVAGCGSGHKADDTTSASTSTTTVNDSHDCPVDVQAASPDEAVSEAQDATGGEATDVADVTDEGGSSSSGLDQGSTLRTYRVWLKDITVNVNGCDNSVTVNDNDTSNDSHAQHNDNQEQPQVPQ